jgi:hypothetical protein
MTSSGIVQRSGAAILSTRAIIDLSAVESVVIPSDSNDWLELIANTGGLIDLSSLEAISGGAGRLNVVLDTGATLRMGSWESVTDLVTIDLNNTGATPGDPTTTLHVLGDVTTSATATLGLDPVTRLDVDGSLVTGNNVDITAPSGGMISVGGHFFFTHTVENELMLGDAILDLDGSGTFLAPQLLEVGGLWVDTDCGFLQNDNFGYGQMVVGQDAQPTVVVLQDDIDNGNTFGGNNPEALYLFGLGPDRCDGAQNALRILGGSTLVIPTGINAYAYILADEYGNSDEIVNLNALVLAEGQPLPDGQGFILPWDQGFIRVVGGGGFEFPSAGAANRIAVGDLDGDLDSDLIIAIPGGPGGTVQVFLNQGNDLDGSWLGLLGLTPVSVGPQPSAVALGLLDGDGHLDAELLEHWGPCP